MEYDPNNPAVGDTAVLINVETDIVEFYTVEEVRYRGNGVRLRDDAGEETFLLRATDGRWFSPLEELEVAFGPASLRQPQIVVYRTSLKYFWGIWHPGDRWIAVHRSEGGAPASGEEAIAALQREAHQLMQVRHIGPHGGTMDVRTGVRHTENAETVARHLEEQGFTITDWEWHDLPPGPLFNVSYMGVLQRYATFQEAEYAAQGTMWAWQSNGKSLEAPGLNPQSLPWRINLPNDDGTPVILRVWKG